MVNEFNGRIGLFLGIACAHTISVCLILCIVKDTIYFYTWSCINNWNVHRIHDILLFKYGGDTRWRITTQQDRTEIQPDPGTVEARVKAEAEVKDLELVQVGTGIIVEFEYGRCKCLPYLNS